MTDRTLTRAAIARRAKAQPMVMMFIALALMGVVLYMLERAPEAVKENIRRNFGFAGILVLLAALVGLPLPLAIGAGGALLARDAMQPGGGMLGSMLGTLFKGGAKNPAGEDDGELCARYGGFSHWVSPASNCEASAACNDGIHYEHIGCD